MTELKVYAIDAISNIPILVYCAVILLLVFGVVFWKKRWEDGKRSIAILLLAGWGTLIYCSAVVFRDSTGERLINILPFWSYFTYAENSYLKEMVIIDVLNICMFLPIGIILKCGFRDITWKRVLVIGLIISMIIEVSQFVFCKGLCEVDDVIHNVVGCMIGYGIAKIMGFTIDI